MQRFKTHPAVQKQLEGGKCIAYGARTMYSGGLQSQSKLTFPGGVLIGDSAGFLDFPRLKGVHTAMKSGMLAGQAIAEEFKEYKNSKAETKFQSVPAGIELTRYPALFKDSDLYKLLYTVRNYKPSFKWGMYGFMIYCGLEVGVGT